MVLQLRSQAGDRQVPVRCRVGFTQIYGVPGVSARARCRAERAPTHEKWPRARTSGRTPLTAAGRREDAAAVRGPHTSGLRDELARRSRLRLRDLADEVGRREATTSIHSTFVAPAAFS